MLRHKSKKGALELSINAIVIIVLAMTVLGLGIVFIRNMFKDIGGTTGTVQEQVKQQILEQLRDSDKSLNFPQEKVTIGKKEVTTLAFGVKNTQSTQLVFVINVTVVDSNPEGLEPPKFFYDKSSFTLNPTESNVYGIDVTAPSASGTHIVKMQLLKPDGSIYAEKSIFMTIQ